MIEIKELRKETLQDLKQQQESETYMYYYTTA